MDYIPVVKIRLIVKVLRSTATPSTNTDRENQLRNADSSRSTLGERNTYPGSYKF